MIDKNIFVKCSGYHAVAIIITIVHMWTVNK